MINLALADKSGIPHDGSQGKGRPNPIVIIITPNQTITIDITNETNIIINNYTTTTVVNNTTIINQTTIIQPERVIVHEKTIERIIERPKLVIITKMVYPDYSRIIGIIFIAIGIGILGGFLCSLSKHQEDSKIVTYYELEEKDSDGSLTRYYKTITE